MATDSLMVLSASYGLLITTGSREALWCYDPRIHGFLGFRKDADA
jgi:hypothetical protein